MTEGNRFQIGAGFILCIFLMSLTMISCDSASDLIQQNKANFVLINTFQQFQNLVLNEKEKPVLLLLTIGTDRMQQCPYCSVFIKVFHELGTRTKEKNNIRFAVSIISMQTKEITEYLRIDRVPMVYLLKPGESTPIKCDLEKDRIQNFIQEHTGIQIDFNDEDFIQILNNDELIQKSAQQQRAHSGQSDAPARILPASIPKYIWFTVTFGLIIAVIFILAPYIKEIRKSSFLTIICFIAYVLFMGGTVFNMIHLPDPFHYSPYHGKVVFIYPELRMQFGAEGYLAIGFTVIAAASFLACTEIVPLVEDEIKKIILSMFLVALFWICFGTVFVFFSMKMPSYMQGTSVYTYVQLANYLFSE